MEDGAIELLIDLTKQGDTPLKLNGIWALMVSKNNSCL